jgi:hypothetical protein
VQFAVDSVRKPLAASDFASVAFPSGHIAVLSSPNILTFCKINAAPNNTMRLGNSTALTARRIVLHPSEPYAVVLFCENRASWQTESGRSVDPNRAPTAEEDFHAWRLLILDVATCAVRHVFDPVASRLLPATANEAAISLGVFTPPEARGAAIFVVGVVPNYRVAGHKFDPKNLPMIRAFACDLGATLRPVHATTVDALPTSFAALAPFGLITAATGRSLRAYSYGTRQLLRKTEVNSIVHSGIVALAAEGSLVAVADFHESIVVVKYYPAQRGGGAVLVAVADHYVPRHVTSLCFVDALTCAVADRFGNVAVLRVPSAAAAAANATALEIQNSTTGSGLEEAIRPAAKLVEVVQFHVGSTVVAQNVVTVGDTVILTYTTVDGTSGAFIPLTSDEFTHCKWIEDAVRTEAVPLVGREHERFRSTYGPSRGVVDVDFAMQQLGSLPGEQRDELNELVRQRALEARALRGTLSGEELTKEELDAAVVPPPTDVLAAIKTRLLN